MAVVGKGCAVLQSGKVQVSGFGAWLPGRSYTSSSGDIEPRLSVFLQWVWTYFTGQRGSELIVNHHGQQPVEAAEEVSSKLAAANSERAIHARPAGIYN